MRVHFGIGRERGAEALQILVAELIHDRQHAAFDFFHLLQPELMDLFGCQIGGRALFHAEGIRRRAIGKRPGAGFGSALGRILVPNKRGELDVGRKHGIADGRQALLAQPLAIGLGDGIGKLVEGVSERAFLGRRRGDAIACVTTFSSRIFGGISPRPCLCASG